MGEAGNVLLERWDRVLASNTAQTAIIHSTTGQSLTFGDLDALAESLRPNGPRPVLFTSGRDSTFVATVLAAWKCGAALCPLDTAPPEEAPPAALLATRRICHIKLTSGSTGTPRQVLFRGEQLLADCDNICATMGLRPEWPNVAVISLAHSYGFSNLVLPLLLQGIPLILAPDALPASVEKCFTYTTAAALPAVPAMWRAWREAGILSPQISLAISAGAPLTLELEQSIFERCGLKVHNFYGSSECGGIAYDRTETPRKTADLAGTAMDNVMPELTADGRLVVCSAAAADSYWPTEVADAETLGGGRFVTGDLAEIHRSEIILTGRASDMINVAGRKVNPGEIEAILSRQFGVECAVVFGIPSRDAERCDDIVAVISTTPLGEQTAIRQAAAAVLPAWKLPRHWWHCPELQANDRGKISRSAWRSKFLQQRPDLIR